MRKKNVLPARVALPIVASALLFALSGCTTAGSNQRSTSHERREVRNSEVEADDYDYFPRYQIYYSRTHREYVYRDGFRWIRRPVPRGVDVAVLKASPSVRLDFHDAPSRHHPHVVRSYPKNWVPPIEPDIDTSDRRADLDGHRNDEDERRNERNDTRGGGAR